MLENQAVKSRRGNDGKIALVVLIMSKKAKSVVSVKVKINVFWKPPPFYFAIIFFLFPRYLRIRLNSTDITKWENKGRNLTNVPLYFSPARIPKSLWSCFFCFADSFSELDHSQSLETELIIHMFFWNLLNKYEREREKATKMPAQVSVFGHVPNLLSEVIFHGPISTLESFQSPC